MEHAPPPAELSLEGGPAARAESWHKLASDIFEYNRRRYIILVDYFSNYVEVGELTGMSSKQVVNFMKAQFARHGIPAELVTDNGPAYSSMEFKKFMQQWQVRHVTSSPHHHQSNGKSERTVQTVKNLLKKCLDSGEDFNLSLLNFRSTPRNGLDSPAQMLMGRRLRTKLPITLELLTEPVDNESNYRALMSQRDSDKNTYNKTAKPLRSASVGNKATLICNGERKPVSIVDRAPEPRSFIVEDEHGRRYRRTRGQLVVRKSGSRHALTPLTQPPPLPPVCYFRSAGTASRCRRKKISDLSNTQLSQNTPPQPVSSSLNDSVIAGSPSPSPPKVNIERSRERTARMLSNLIFGSPRE